MRKDSTGSVKAYKVKTTEKIDEAVAMNIVLGRAIRYGNETGESVQDSRGLIIFYHIRYNNKPICVVIIEYLHLTEYP